MESYVHRHDLRESYPSSPFSLTHRRYIQRTSWIMGTIRRHVPLASTVLEIGSAQGNMSLMLAEEGYRTVAADIELDFLNYSRKKYEHGCIEWLHGDVFRLPAERAFDAVILAEIIEHVAHPEDLIAKALQWVRPDGLLVITTPNHHMRDRTPSFAEARRDVASLERSQFGPGGESHLFTLAMQELLDLMPRKIHVLDSRHIGSILDNDRLQPLWNTLFPRSVLRVMSAALPRVPMVRSRVSLHLAVAARNG